MKTKTKICLIISLIFCINMYAQNPIKQVFYKTTTTKIFAVPDSTDMKAITNFDFAKIHSTNTVTNTDMVIDENRDLTITNINEQEPRYENDYEFEIGKVVTNKFGTILYDHKGGMLNNDQFIEVDKNFTLDENSIESYGIMPEIQIDDKLFQMYTSQGFTVSVTDDGAFSAINDSVEIYIDPVKLIMEMRLFKENQLQISDWKQYQKVDDKIIPKVFVMTTYDLLSAGIRLQISEVTNYNSYTILNNSGETVVSFAEKSSTMMNQEGIVINQFKEMAKKGLNIVISPNPTTSNINVEIPLFGKENVNVEIINSFGSTVLKLNDVKNDNTINIDVSSLTNGVYTLRCTSGKQFKSARFVKL
jgi:hypothetical protein